MSEGNQLVRALEQQAKVMNIDNRETIAVIERLINDIGKCFVYDLFPSRQ